MENSCVTLDKVGECVINKLGTVAVVVVVVVVVVVGLYASIHHESFILMPWSVNHSNVEGLCPGTLYRSTVEGSCPGML